MGSDLYGCKPGRQDLGGRFSKSNLHSRNRKLAAENQRGTPAIIAIVSGKKSWLNEIVTLHQLPQWIVEGAKYFHDILLNAPNLLLIEAVGMSFAHGSEDVLFPPRSYWVVSGCEGTAARKKDSSGCRGSRNQTSRPPSLENVRRVALSTDSARRPVRFGAGCPAPR